MAVAVADIIHGERALIIFIRNPLLGKVKTRLAADTGNGRALEIYNELLRHTRTITSRANCTRYLYYSDFIDTADEWPGDIFQKKMQHEGSLGEKMRQAFEEILSTHRSVVIIGSDCYALRNTHIETAFEKLETADVVIGPAEDGGYYLLGMKRLIPPIFEGIEWGTGKVLQQTLQATQTLEKDVVTLETLPDIDTLADWERRNTGYET
jgi:uncharacterized protein